LGEQDAPALVHRVGFSSGPERSTLLKTYPRAVEAWETISERCNPAVQSDAAQLTIGPYRDELASPESADQPAASCACPFLMTESATDSQILRLATSAAARWAAGRSRASDRGCVLGRVTAACGTLDPICRRAPGAARDSAAPLQLDAPWPGPTPAQHRGAGSATSRARRPLARGGGAFLAQVLGPASGGGGVPRHLHVP